MGKQVTMQLRVGKKLSLGRQTCNQITNSLRRPQKTYKMKSIREIGMPIVANSSNNPLAFYT
jgi:hypothetical protein